jgi:hypothetical protein
VSLNRLGPLWASLPRQLSSSTATTKCWWACPTRYGVELSRAEQDPRRASRVFDNQLTDLDHVELLRGGIAGDCTRWFAVAVSNVRWVIR